MNKVKDYMTKPVVTLEKGNKVFQACLIMSELNIGFLPIVENGTPIGVITDRDIVLGIARGITLESDVKNLIVSDVISVKYDSEIGIASCLMGENQIRRLVVIDDNNKICGVISLGDLAICDETDQKAGLALSDISLESNTKDSIGRFAEVDDFIL